MTDLKIGRECTEQGLPCQPQKRAFSEETARYRAQNLAVARAPEYSTEHPLTEAAIAFRAGGERHPVAKELPILPTPPSPQEGAQEEFLYTRVFCLRENSPPLRLLLDFLKSKGQVPLIPEIRAGGDAGKPIVVSSPDSPASATFREIGDAILLQLSRKSAPVVETA